MDNDALRALIMNAPLGIHGTSAAPPVLPVFPALPPLPTPIPAPQPFPVPLKRPFPGECNGFPGEPMKRLKLGEGPWKHAGLMSEYGGIKEWMRMKRGEIPWPVTERTEPGQF